MQDVDTEDCGSLKHKIQDLIDDKIIDFNSPEKPHMANAMYNQKGRNERNLSVEAVPQQRSKQGAPKRQFTKINMSLAQALQHLLRANLITVRDPPISPYTSACSYNPNARCAYHSDSPGHDTNSCWPLKNKIQDMIDAGEIEFNHPRTPMVITAPMHNHDKTD